MNIHGDLSSSNIVGWVKAQAATQQFHTVQDHVGSRKYLTQPTAEGR